MTYRPYRPYRPGEHRAPPVPQTPLRRWLPDPDDERHVVWVQRAAWVVLAAALLTFLARGADGPSDPLIAPEAGATVRTPLEGFGEIAFRIQRTDGSVADWCALLAETDAARAQGLRGQLNLRGYDAMVFRFPEPTQAPFTMRGVTVPIEIAFFDPAGVAVHVALMEPCPADGDCPDHHSPVPYTTAMETFTAGMASLGVAPGAVLSFPGGGCGA